jgi:hypothetical protein
MFRRVNNVFLMFLFLFNMNTDVSCANIREGPFMADWSYKIAHLGHFLRIDVVFKNAQGSSTKFKLPSYYLTHCTGDPICIISKDIIRLNKSYKYKLDLKNAYLTIYHNPGQDLEIQYDILSTLSNLFPRDSAFGPVVKKQYFYAPAFGLLLMLDNKSKKYSDLENYNITWVLPQYFGRVSSEFGITDHHIFAHNFSTKAHTPFIGGNVIKYNIDKNLKAVYVGIPKQRHMEFNNMINSTSDAISKLFSCDTDNNIEYTVNIVGQIEKNLQKDRSMGLGDTKNSNIFIYNLDKGVSNFYVSSTIIHEMLHQWIGTRIKIDNCGWFGEGFTDYYAMKINTHMNHHLKDLVEYYNLCLIHEYTYTSNEDTESSNFWIQNRLQSYVFGQLLASNLNYKISQHSSGKYCLDDIMRDLYKLSLIKNTKLSIEDFFQIGNVYWSEFSRYTESILNKKSTLQHSSGELGKCVKSLNKKFALANYGFNYYEALQNLVATDLKKNNILYKMGLRNKHKFLNARIVDKKHPLLPIELTWEDKNKVQHSIVMFRAVDFIEVPQFELDQKMYNQFPENCLEVRGHR